MQVKGKISDFAGTVMGALAVGFAIDYVFKIQPWGMLAMTVVGAVSGFMQIIRTMSDDKPDSLVGKDKQE